MSRSSSPADARAGIIKKAALIALLGNAILAAGKIAVGFVSGSLAVLGDGVDSSGDVLIALMGLAISFVIRRPADVGHPWGHARAETMATTAVSFALFYAGAQLAISGAGRLLSPPEGLEMPDAIALVATIVSIAGKTALAYSQFALAKRANSGMLRANAVNMRGDIAISAAVLAGLGLGILLDSPLADSIVATLVGLWVIKAAFGIFREANLELMDGTEGLGEYQAVFEAALSVEGVRRPHKARMRKIADKWDIDLDIEVDGSICLAAAHDIASRVEAAVKERLPEVYDIVVHVEPEGAHEAEGEGFGLCEHDIR
jgi:cation diffusion facilitator family transporter